MIKIKIAAKEVESFFTKESCVTKRISTMGILLKGCSLMGSRFDNRNDLLELSFDDGLEEVTVFSLETK